MIAVLLITIALLQQPKSATLKGTVESVDMTTKRIAVANEAIPGGMGAMTMKYKVENDAALTSVKPGDKITATFFEGDLTLYNLQVFKGQETGTLTLDDLERMALATNPAMAIAQANIRASAALSKQAGYYPNPTVGYYGDEIRGGYSGGGKQGGFVSQTIVTGGKLAAAKRVAQAQTRQSETTAEARRLRLLNSVRMAFYQVLADQRMVEVKQNLAKIADDATETAHQLSNIGQADRPVVLQAEVEQRQIDVGVQVSQQRLKASWRMLAAVVGNQSLPQAKLDADLEALPALNYEDWLAKTLLESPELTFAQQAIDRAEASLAQARKVPIPDLQINASLSQNFEPLESTRQPVGLQGGVQIGVQIPIFNRNQGGIAASKAQLEAAKQDLANVKLRIAREVANLFRDYESAGLTAKQYKTEMLPRAEEAYNLYRKNYQSMSGAYAPSLLAQRTLFQLQADYVQALANAWQAAIGIRGFGLMDSMP